MDFKERPSWHSPVICETIRDEDDEPKFTKLSVGIRLVEGNEVKWKLMDKMIASIEKVLEEEGII